MQIEIFILICKTSVPIKGNVEELRGFFGKEFRQYIELHNHLDDKFIYGYSIIQYKIIDGLPMIIGIGRGADILKKIYDKFGKIRLGENVYEVPEKIISVKIEEFGKTDYMIPYRFITPWYPFDNENKKEFDKLRNMNEMKTFLGNKMPSQLVDHMSTTLGYRVPDYKIYGKVKCVVNHIKINKNTFHGIILTTFMGEFRTNFIIPDYLGIGGKTAFGFGTVKRIM